MSNNEITEREVFRDVANGFNVLAEGVQPKYDLYVFSPEASDVVQLVKGPVLSDGVRQGRQLGITAHEIENPGAQFTKVASLVVLPSWADKEPMSKAQLQDLKERAFLAPKTRRFRL